MTRKGLIVEDLPDTRQWLEHLLPNIFPGMDIDSAGSVESAHRALDRRCPDLALVDLGLPDGNGLELVERLTREAPDCLTVISTIFDDDRHLFAALKAGARGYLLKDQGQAEMKELLLGIESGKPPLSPAIARRLLEFFAPTGKEQKSPLTDREREVLGLIGKGYTLVIVAGMLDISRNTAAGYVKEIYRKLRINSRAEAAMEASRLGLVSFQSE